MTFHRATVLLAHHGTVGAKLAEELAFELAEPGKTRLIHLLVVPDFWAGMQGDDWLNNASTRDVFADYVERMLEREAAEQLRAVEARCQERRIAYHSALRVGDPTECLMETALREQADLVIVGPPRAKGQPGFRSGLNFQKLVRDLPAPLLVAARPRPTADKHA